MRVPTCSSSTSRAAVRDRGGANGARALRHEGANLLEEHQTLPKVPSSFTEHNGACNAGQRLMQDSETAGLGGIWQAEVGGSFRRVRAKGGEMMLRSRKRRRDADQRVKWGFKGQETGLHSLPKPSYASNTKQQAQRSQKRVCAK